MAFRSNALSSPAVIDVVATMSTENLSAATNGAHGTVTNFSYARPTLSEIFREVVGI